MRTFYLLLLSSSFTLNALGQAIDSSFGVNGVVIMPFDKYLAGNNDQLTSIIQQPDGKILAADISFSLLRFNVNGIVDSSFATHGRVKKKIANYGSSSASSVLVQADGKIVLAGSSNYPQTLPDTRRDFTAAHFHADGTVDLSFNGTGDISIDIQNAEYDDCNGAVLQADDKIVMFGSSGNAAAIIRLNTDGSLDNSFNGDGKFYAEYGIYGDELNSAVVCPDGKIIACGKTSISGDVRFLILKFKQNGELDSTFGIDGAVITDFSGSGSFANDIALQNDGKIVVAGSDLWVGGVMARYNADGILDNSFGNGGKVEASISAGNISPRQLVITADGSLFIAGHIYVGSYEDLYFVKYKPDGNIDSSFSDTGIIIQLSPYSERINSILLQHDGKILTAGWVRDGQSYQYAMVRYTPFPVKVRDAPALNQPIALYPNPASGKFTIGSLSDGEFTIKSSLGQTILTQKIIKGENTLQFPPNTVVGTYTAIFESVQGHKTTTIILYTP